MFEDGLRRWNPWWAEKQGIEPLVGVERSALGEIMKTAGLTHIKDIIGVRRAGKTTVMYQVIKALIDRGAKPKDIVFLNFDDPEISAPPFGDILKLLGKINPDFKYLFVDEIPQKSGWEGWIRTLYDTRAFKQIFVSGSSASLLSRDVGRVLTGRHITFPVHPFSFREYLSFMGWKNFSTDFLEYKKNKLLYHLGKYIVEGGFPETAGKADYERVIILTNIYNDILSRDISSRFGASYEIARMLSYHLLSNISNEFSYNSVAKATGLTIETVQKYLGFLKESLMVLTLDFFSYKTKVQFKQNKKAYSIDTGLRNAVAFSASEDLGRLAENAVYAELRRRGRDIYYWKNAAGRSVDFLVRDGLRVKNLIQVCLNPSNPKTKSREVRGLAEAMAEFKLNEGVVITEDSEMEEEVGNGKIRFVPLWKWLLEK